MNDLLTGELQPRGFVKCSWMPKGDNYQEVNSAWCKGVSLWPSKGKTRMACVWLNNYGASTYFGDVFTKVRVPSNLSDEHARNEAQYKAYRKGKGYSWTMWARQQVKEKYPKLIDDPSFKQILKNLMVEWMPFESEEGRTHITKTLNLRGFEANAYDILLFEPLPRKALVAYEESK